MALAVALAIYAPTHTPWSLRRSSPPRRLRLVARHGGGPQYSQRRGAQPALPAREATPRGCCRGSGGLLMPVLTRQLDEDECEHCQYGVSKCQILTVPQRRRPHLNHSPPMTMNPPNTPGLGDDSEQGGQCADEVGGARVGDGAAGSAAEPTRCWSARASGCTV